MTTITLDQFHDLLSESYAVSLNDTLYFVGYDSDDGPYVSDNDGRRLHQLLKCRRRH
jgi:hypothetical protein